MNRADLGGGESHLGPLIFEPEHVRRARLLPLGAGLALPLLLLSLVVCVLVFLQQRLDEGEALQKKSYHHVSNRSDEFKCREPGRGPEPKRRDLNLDVPRWA
jgi:hypothetical protein